MGVRRNFERVAAVAATLGAVPQLVSAADLADQGPDEKAMLLYTAFMCSRLMEVSQEDRAAAMLQGAWRTHRLRAPGAPLPLISLVLAVRIERPVRIDVSAS